MTPVTLTGLFESVLRRLRMVGDDGPAGQCDDEPGNQQEKNAHHDYLSETRQLCDRRTRVVSKADHIRPPLAAFASVPAAAYAQETSQTPAERPIAESAERIAREF